MNKKIKHLIITTAFILLVSTTTTFIINDFESAKITKMINDDDDEKTHISIIAHRGFSSLEIENSIEAIKLGFEDNSTTGVEIDIHLTKDKQIVAIHDNSINNKQIKETTFEELQKETITIKNFNTDYIASLFDNTSGNLIRERIKLIKNKKAKIPSLKEILDLYKDYQNKELIIEFKFENNEEDFTEEFYKLISNYDYQNIIIQSNNYEALTKMKETNPNFKYHLIIQKDNYDLINNLDLDGYVIRKNLVNYDDIKNLIEKNKQISVWTINSYDEYKTVTNELKDLKTKVSYITNYPDALKVWNDIIEKDKPTIKKYVKSQ